jgi:hypothetical protein
MERKIVMWVVIGALFLAVLFLTFRTSGQETGKATGQIDMNDWTENEKMNYEMHGLVPARAQGSVPSTSAGSGMVGGC